MSLELTPPSPIELDPFSYFPNVASLFADLGGAERRPELGYGFHTQYVRCAPGHCHIHLKIDNLIASSGILYLQIHMLSTQPGSHASIATIERLPLIDLMFADGRASVRFESIQGMTYAVFGRVVDVTDARASALTLTLDRPGSDDQDSMAKVEPTPLGRSSSCGVERLVSAVPPTLANPVSQICTPSQFSEPVFTQWCKALGENTALSCRLWQQAFLLQVLDRYGFLRSGARVLGLGGFNTALPAFLANQGVKLLMGYHAPVDEPLSEWLALKSKMIQRPHLSDAETIARQVHIHPVYMPAPHSSLGQFDACWSYSILDKSSNSLSKREFIEHCLERVDPGGIAVHLFQTSSLHELEKSDQCKLNAGDRQNEIESLALSMISHGHQVAQLRFNKGQIYVDETGLSAFGLIIRRSIKA